MQNRKTIKIFLLLGDVCITQIALFLTLFLRNRNLLLLGQFNTFSYNFIILYFFWILILFILNLYDLYFLKKPTDFFLNLIIFSIVATFSGVTYFYFRPELGLTPKTILILNVLVFDVLFSLWRYACNVFFHIKRIREKVAIVGFQNNLEGSMSQIKKNYDIVAIFSPSLPDNNNQSVLPNSTDIIYNIDDFKKIVIEKKVTSIIFALDFYSNKDLVQKIFSHLPLTLNYIDFNDLYEFMYKKVSLEHLNEIWFLENISKSENKLEEIIKRCFDIFFSLFGLLLYVILLPIISLAINIDSKGGPFYTQKRVGKNGKVFTIRKFRTMKKDEDQDKKIWREKSKDTITRVGKTLRRIHLDELPQAWSIFKGDLSFVGPRPEWIELSKIFEKEIPFYKQRYLVKPGIIGWAQINFPASHSVEEVKEKFQYDLYYIKNRSLLLDLEIIFKAIKLFFW